MKSKFYVNIDSDLKEAFDKYIEKNCVDKALLFEKLIKKHLENCGWKESIVEETFNVTDEEDNECGIKTRDKTIWKSISECSIDNEYFEEVALNINDWNIDEESFVAELEEIKNRIKKIGVVYGEFKPFGVLETDFQLEVSLKNVSHTINKISYDKASGDLTIGIKFLNTPKGILAKEQIMMFKSINNSTGIENNFIKLAIVPRMVGIGGQYGSKKIIKKIFTFDFKIDAIPRVPGIIIDNYMNIEYFNYKIETSKTEEEKTSWINQRELLLECVKNEK